jgi:hypothetical protein
LLGFFKPNYKSLRILPKKGIRKKTITAVAIKGNWYLKLTPQTPIQELKRKLAKATLRCSEDQISRKFAIAITKEEIIR